MNTLTATAKALIAICAVVAIAACALFAHASTIHFTSTSLTVLALSIITARLKVRIPGSTSSMCLNLPFLVLAIAWFTPVEAIVITLASTLSQTVLNAKWQLNPIARIVFNVAIVADSAAAALYVRQVPEIGNRMWLTIAATAVCLFIGSTIFVSLMLAISESKSLAKTWMQLAEFSFPLYLIGGGMTALASLVARPSFGPLANIVLGITCYLVYRSYKQYAAMSVPQPMMARAAHA